MKNNYTLKSCEDLIELYLREFKGQMTILEEGVLGLGTILLHSAEGKKTIVIKEFFISAWSSGHSIRRYNKMPKKYVKLLEKI
jgi:hypothetical protein